MGVERERRREREKGNSWSDGKESDSYRKAINEYGRLRVSIPTESFFSSLSSRSLAPLWKRMQMGEEGIQQWVDVKCWGASELKQESTRCAWCSQSSGSRLQYHVTHSAAKIKHVRTLLPLRLEAPILSSLPSSFIPFSFFPPHVCRLLIRVKRPPLPPHHHHHHHHALFSSKTGPSFLVRRHHPASGISIWRMTFFFLKEKTTTTTLC